MKVHGSKWSNFCLGIFYDPLFCKSLPILVLPCFLNFGLNRIYNYRLSCLLVMALVSSTTHALFVLIGKYFFAGWISFFQRFLENLLIIYYSACYLGNISYCSLSYTVSIQLCQRNVWSEQTRKYFLFAFGIVCVFMRLFKISQAMKRSWHDWPVSIFPLIFIYLFLQ